MPSQTQIYYDLNTLYTRYEASGTAAGGVGASISYYGYSNTGITDATPGFSIKKVYYLSNIQYVDWSNNIVGNFEATWTNRAYYFATPSNITITATAYGSSIYNITFKWTTATGSSRYYVALFKNNGIIYNLLDAGGPQHNPYQNTHLNQVINGNSITIQNCPSGYTYSASVYASNGVAVSSTATVNISV